MIIQPVSVSAGIAYLPAGETSVTVDELIRRAYEAVLRAKETDRGRVEVYSEAEERDGLTGLLKRAGMIARLDKACTEADRGRSNVAMVCFDVDEFDGINRQFGRYTGDEVLRRVARNHGEQLQRTWCRWAHRRGRVHRHPAGQPG